MFSAFAIPRKLKSRLRSSFDAVLSRLVVLGTAGVVVLIALAITVVARAEPSERIRIGNTGGSLTALVEVQDDRILVGAGPSRSHGADFVGRSTRPWDRDIDLLIVPGWDDEHATGALGLLGRHTIHGIVVIDLPGEAPIWAMLERHARAQGTAIRFIESAHRLRIGADTVLKVTPVRGDVDGAWIRLEHEGFRVDFIDAAEPDALTPPPAAFRRQNDHVMINMRSQNVPDGIEPALLVQRRPFWDDEFGELGARFVIELERNDHTELRFEGDELRAPIEDLSS